ncbi:MAG TPA: CehA/McbA family metallohydrolase [bacterium]|nr:CehA/McbA family metallohydrolase [bacterium]
MESFRAIAKRGAAALAAALFLAGCGGGGGGEEGTSAAREDDTPVTERGTFLHIIAPSVAKAGEELPIRVRVLTQAGLPDYDFEGAFKFEASSQQAAFQDLTVEPMQEGWFDVSGVTLNESGVQFLRGLVPNDTVQALANAIVVQEDPEFSIYWGDLNGHSDLSTGAKAPGVYFWYAKAVGLLDFAVLTDNDHEDAVQKVLDEVAFRDVCQVVDEEYNEDGLFAGFVGFEWTSREYGNRLVTFSQVPDVLPTVASGVDTPAKLRAAVPEGSVITLAHPSGSKESSPADPASVGSEDLVEIYSTLGIFETAGSPRPTTQETAGAFVRDLLKGGFRAGFVGTSDTRLSTPGNPRGFSMEDHPWPNGLTAVVARELTREGVLEALRAGRCYATTGQRYLLEFTVDGNQMGSELTVPNGHQAEVYGSLGSTSKWARVEIVGPAGPIAELTPAAEDADVVELSVTTDPVSEPTYVYLRGVDEFGGMAWSSPVYLIPE